jgi:hypothetical protein
MKRCALLCCLAACTLVLSFPHVGFAWSVNTHMYSAAVIHEDLMADGMLQVNRLERAPDGTFTEVPLSPIPVDPVVVEAARQFPECFFAGSCSADGYPDLYVGQSIIHPYEPGQHWRAIDWARHVVKCARDYSEGDKHTKAVAFAAGFLIHYAGDAFGHTWVNSYAGGCWDWGRMDIVQRHVVVESFVNSRLPWAGPPRPDMDSSFLRDALMIHDDVERPLQPSGFLTALTDYYRGLDDAVGKCNDIMDKWWNWTYGAAEVAALAKPYLVDLRNDADRALYEWGETSNRVMREMSENHPHRVPTVISEWGSDWILDLALGIPSPVEELLDLLGAPMNWISQPVGRALDRLVDWTWDHVAAGPFESLVNPDDFMVSTYSEADRARVAKDLALEAGGGKLDPTQFAALRDTIALGKLTLMNEAGIASLSGQLGVEIPFSGSDDNILWSCISSLDASNQLALYPKFRLLETDELKTQAFEKLFRSGVHEQEPTTLDPAHILCFIRPGTRDIWFGVPVPDPGAEGCKLVGSVYEGTGQTLHRTQIFAEDIPTTGVAGGSIRTITASWTAMTDRFTAFHLAISRPVEGSNEPAEDLGLDVALNVKLEALPDTTMPGMADAMEQMGAAAQFAAAMAEAFAQAGMDTPQSEEILAAWQRMQEQMAEAQAAAAAGAAQAATGEPMVPSEAMVTSFMEAIQNPGDTPWGNMTEEAQSELASARIGIGTLEDAQGNPVPAASVTLVPPAVVTGLRAATELPSVRLDFLWPSQYLMGRTNEAGHFVVQGIKDGPYTLIATAPGQPKLEAPVYASLGQALGVILPVCRFGEGTVAAAPPAAEGEGGEGGEEAVATAYAAPPGPGGDDFGQLQRPPSFTLERGVPLLTGRDLQADGSASMTLRVRPLSKFAGPVEFSVEGLPEGVTVELPEGPVEVSDLTEVPVRFIAAPEARDRALVTIRATSGDLTAEQQVMVALGRGALQVEPAELTVKAGKTTRVQLTWSGAGEMAAVTCGTLPAGLSVRVETVRSHPGITPVPMDNLTTNRLVQAVAPLRASDEGLARHPVQRPTLTKAQLRAAPAEILQRGCLLSPEGWLKVRVTAAKGLAPGRYEVPVECKVGELVVREVIPVTVEP